ncbi:MAG: hypothetical protein EOO78_01540 [Oxalobacteraceae bacterium]|nr:MAG: hypothetical protein EOO78_01540 [Oxalobacteraceae bacterium]
MYALDAASGKIAWEYYLVPKSSADPTRGPQGSGAAQAAWPSSVTWAAISTSSTAPAARCCGSARWEARSAAA